MHIKKFNFLLSHMTKCGMNNDGEVVLNLSHVHGWPSHIAFSIIRARTAKKT